MGVDVFQRLGPRVSQSQKRSVFQRLGPVSGDTQPKRSVFQRLGPCSGRVHKRQPKKSVFLRLGPDSGEMSVGVFKRQVVNYYFVYDSLPQKAAVSEKKQEDEEISESEENKKTNRTSDEYKQEVCVSEEKKQKICDSEEKKPEICQSGEKLDSPCFSCVAQLEGHQNAVTGVAFPSGIDKFYTASEDHNVRAWDCNSGKCVGAFNLGGEVGCMFSEGPCIFVGTHNSIKIWNTQLNQECTLGGSIGGQVNAIAVTGDRLFAGVEDGKILSWRFDAATNSFQPSNSLIGHTSAVASLAVSPDCKLLYSASADQTIRIWNLESSECQQILTGHSGGVTSLIAVEHNIVSCSLDGTIKAWAASSSSNGMFELKHTHSEKCGFLSLCGVNDLEAKPVLLCSCNDNTVRAYGIPSFTERGKIHSKGGVRSIRLGPAGVFCTEKEMARLGYGNGPPLRQLAS